MSSERRSSFICVFIHLAIFSVVLFLSCFVALCFEFGLRFASYILPIYIVGHAYLICRKFKAINLSGMILSALLFYLAGISVLWFGDPQSSKVIFKWQLEFIANASTEIYVEYYPPKGYNGLWHEWSPVGKLSWQVFLVNGIPDGTIILYNKDETIKAAFSVKEGVLEGDSVFYDDERGEAVVMTFRQGMAKYRNTEIIPNSPMREFGPEYELNLWNICEQVRFARSLD